jgi:hypothetical protein
MMAKCMAATTGTKLSMLPYNLETISAALKLGQVKYIYVGGLTLFCACTVHF